MKPLPLLIGIIVVLVLLCTPVFAISTSDLISQHRPQGTETNTLSVTSDPVGAEVYLDGVHKGTTPVTITGVSTGLHLIRVTMSGYEDYSSRVITPNDNTVHASLNARSGSTSIPTIPTRIPTTITTRIPTTITTPIPTTVPTTIPTGQLAPSVMTGTLSVTSSPAGADIYLDGVHKGNTPVTITGVSTGLHLIRVTLAGYEDYSSRVIIANDKTVHVSLKVQSGSTTISTRILTTVPTTVPTGQLPPNVMTGTLSVTSSPVGADVYLDGAYKGTTSGEEHWIERNHPPYILRRNESGEYESVEFEYSGKPPGEATSGIDMFWRSLFYRSEWEYQPVTITGVPFGSHNLRVTKSGYEDYSSWIMIPDDKEVHVSLKFVGEVTCLMGKPNIYLYSDRDLTASVRLFPETAITVSDPPYSPGIGWKAEIRNGSLNGQGDFLFYEGTGHFSGWQKEEGYVIRGAYREQDMASMLGEFGFNEKETDEFIEYWACHLAGDGDYVLYPQETDTVNQAMSLSIVPKPDAVSRIWFYAESFASAPNPVTNPEKISREGFYVVEWGVIIQDVTIWDR